MPRKLPGGFGTFGPTNLLSRDRRQLPEFELVRIEHLDVIAITAVGDDPCPRGFLAPFIEEPGEGPGISSRSLLAMRSGR